MGQKPVRPSAQPTHAATTHADEPGWSSLRKSDAITVSATSAEPPPGCPYHGKVGGVAPHGTTTFKSVVAPVTTDDDADPHLRGRASIALELDLSSQSILEMLPEVVILIDRDSLVQWANKQVLKQLGWSPADLIGQNIQVLIPRNVYPNMDHAKLTRAYTAGCPSSIVGHTERLVTVQRKDGTITDMRLAVTQQGDLFCGTLTAVEGTSGMSDQVLALVSHETRNFLMVARGSVEAVGHLLVDRDGASAHGGSAQGGTGDASVVAPLAAAAAGDDTGATGSANTASAEEVRNCISTALEAIDSSVSVLRDLSTMSQAASKTLQCNRDWMRVADVMEKLSAHASSFSGKSAKRLVVSTQCDVPENVSVELGIQHVEQLMMNLVANALKYANSEVAVAISCSMPPAPDNPLTSPRDKHVRLSIAVDDNGPGISVDDRKVLFQQHVRLRRAVDRQFMGSGLGLHLCAVFAAEHDGKVEIHDSVRHDTGSLFVATLGLPFRLVRPGQDHAAIDMGPDSKNPLEAVRCSVLVVDDMLLIRRVVEKFVQRVMPLAVVSGASSVEEARHMCADRHYDLILTDYSLPDGTGSDVIAGQSGSICVCVSGSNPPSGVFDAVLLKPVSYSDMRRLLSEKLAHLVPLTP